MSVAAEPAVELDAHGLRFRLHGAWADVLERLRLDFAWFQGPPAAASSVEIEIGTVLTRAACCAAGLARAQVWTLTLGRDHARNWEALQPLLR